MHMGFRSLRVLNEDRVVPGAGFPEHRHEDMDIVTIVLEGALAHRDRLGNHSVVRAGDVLSPREAEALLAQMDGVDFRAHCPHGRPVLLRIGVAEIGRRLGR
jgi:DNA mismatch repair ATPase MutL